jgi:hypothetical protein
MLSEICKCVCLIRYRGDQFGQMAMPCVRRWGRVLGVALIDSFRHDGRLLRGLIRGEHLASRACLHTTKRGLTRPADYRAETFTGCHASMKRDIIGSFAMHRMRHGPSVTISSLGSIWVCLIFHPKPETRNVPVPTFPAHNFEPRQPDTRLQTPTLPRNNPKEVVFTVSMKHEW